MTGTANATYISAKTDNPCGLQRGFSARAELLVKLQLQPLSYRAICHTVSYIQLIIKLVRFM